MKPRMTVAELRRKLRSEAKTTKAGSDFISGEISHQIKDKGKSQKQAIAIAHAVAREKGYKVPKNPNESVTEGRLGTVVTVTFDGDKGIRMDGSEKKALWRELADAAVGMEWDVNTSNPKAVKFIAKGIPAQGQIIARRAKNLQRVYPDANIRVMSKGTELETVETEQMAWLRCGYRLETEDNDAPAGTKLPGWMKPHTKAEFSTGKGGSIKGVEIVSDKPFWSGFEDAAAVKVKWPGGNVQSLVAAKFLKPMSGEVRAEAKGNPWLRTDTASQLNHNLSIRERKEPATLSEALEVLMGEGLSPKAQANYNAVAKIVDEKQMGKVDGKPVDLYSASAIKKVADALTDANKEKFLNLPAVKMAKVAFQMLESRKRRMQEKLTGPARTEAVKKFLSKLANKISEKAPDVHARDSFDPRSKMYPDAVHHVALYDKKTARNLGTVDIKEPEDAVEDATTGVLSVWDETHRFLSKHPLSKIFMLKDPTPLATEIVGLLKTKTESSYVPDAMFGAGPLGPSAVARMEAVAKSNTLLISLGTKPPDSSDKRSVYKVMGSSQGSYSHSIPHLLLKDSDGDKFRLEFFSSGGVTLSAANGTVYRPTHISYSPDLEGVFSKVDRKKVTLSKLTENAGDSFKSTEPEGVEDLTEGMGDEAGGRNALPPFYPGQDTEIDEAAQLSGQPGNPTSPRFPASAFPLAGAHPAIDSVDPTLEESIQHILRASALTAVREASNYREVNKDLIRFFKLSPESAAKAVKMMKAANTGSEVEAALSYLNKMIGGHGVEAVNGNGPGGYWMDSVLHYVNMGDTYRPTICYDTNANEFFVGSWGDWVEQHGEEYKVESGHSYQEAGGLDDEAKKKALTIATDIARHLKSFGASTPKPIGPYRFSDPNEAASFVAYSQNYGQPLTVVVAAFAGDDFAVRGFIGDHGKSKSFSETDAYHDIMGLFSYPHGLPRAIEDVKDGLIQMDKNRASWDGTTSIREIFHAESTNSEFDKIGRGSRVTIRTPQGQQISGKAVMRGPAGWVLNMGGAHGTPGIATEKNTVKVSGKGKPDYFGNFLRGEASGVVRRSSHAIPRGKDYSFKNWDDPWKMMSAEDRHTANQLQIKILKVMPSSPIQKELQAKLNVILKKYGKPTVDPYTGKLSEALTSPSTPVGDLTGKLDPKERERINGKIAKAGFDGNRRFVSVKEALRTLWLNLEQFGITQGDTIMANELLGSSGTRSFDVSFRRKADQPMDVKIKNSQVYIQWTELAPGRFEVIAYLT